MEERWLPLHGFGNAYSISSRGSVMRTAPRNLRRAAIGSRAKPFKPSPITAFPGRTGYLRVRIGPVGQQKTVEVHRLVAITFVANPKALPCVNHRDGDKSNNAAANLEWVTHSENIRHAIETGLQPILRGVLHGNSKLTPRAIIAIRKDARAQRLIAADYRIDQTLVSKIKLRRIWTHVPDQL